MKRRSFIKKSLLAAPVLAGGASWLAACSKPNLLPGAGQNVVVIGAGIAGIYAAQLLLDEGYEVLVLEASDRWGGRIASLENFTDFEVELGAEYVHGTNSEWHRLLVKAGAMLQNDAPLPIFYQYGNQLLTEKQANLNADCKRAFDFIDETEIYSGQDKTVKTAADAEGVPATVRHLVNAQTGNEWGTSYNRLSMLGIAEENKLWSAGNADFRLIGSTFSREIEDLFPEALTKIQLNSPVKSIDYQSNRVKVTTQNGDDHFCNYALVTVPLTVLKDGDITFLPALLTPRVNALQRIGMGAGMKIVLKFSSAFWGATTGYVYAAGPAPLYWHTSLGRGGNDHILTAFVMGEKAEQLAAIGEAAAVKALVDDLDTLYAGAATTAFQKAHVLDWGKKPFIRGAYSYPLVGGGISKRQTIAAPLSNRVFFAGEATHTEGHNSTVHGAMEMAKRAVEEILAL